MSDLLFPETGARELARLGLAALEEQRFENAIEIFSALAQIEPLREDALFNLGVAYNGQAFLLANQGLNEEALALCNRALEIAADDLDALHLQGFIQLKIGRFADAANSYWQATQIAPQHSELWSNLGTALFSENHMEEAVGAYGRAIALDPDAILSVTNHAFALTALTRHKEALTSFERALQLQPGDARLTAGLLVGRANICDWRDRETLLAETASNIETGGIVLGAFDSLALYENTSIHKRCAEIALGATHIAGSTTPQSIPTGKIRIGYLSADLRQHPVSQLMVEVFEGHDRSAFETIAFSAHAPVEDAMQARLRGAFDEFYDIAELTFAELADFIAAKNIEILVDLTGLTTMSRTAALAGRPAPVQVNFLGFPGTLGAGFIDYIIGDHVVTPPGCEACYAEKVVRLPNAYLPSSSRQSAAMPTRAAYGLPDNGIVFCSFNHGYKITPQRFSSWMRILDACPGSVLWLPHKDGLAENLRREAESHGIDPDRLVFADRLPTEAQHLARLGLADIALDTSPYGGHTTTSDALWAGVPVVTSAGSTFASRVAASLAAAAGVPELDRASNGDYEAFAILLASDTQRLSNLKAKLLAARETAALFDTARFTRDLEAVYAEMSARFRRGQAPESFDLPRGS